ncbi:Uncharacterized protein APZ42_029854 [Daphnia magna]|uniref:CRC domain-containing protein n=1 Tax=Daphnia magna TaxID=35525 RepID=A0A164P9K7_9CRUS|nr:Uncharacterized protein APZ42_029854 [Daphnia magna]
MSNHCNCRSTDCKACICFRNKKYCNINCKCHPDRCRNKEMDPNALAAAIANLAANQQRQQQQFQTQQDVLTALTNRLLAAPAVAAPANPIPAPTIRTTLDPDIKYSGSNDESLRNWLQLINRKAPTEGWQDADKRRAAISSLFGKALTWHEEIGLILSLWADWLANLRGTFEIQLIESQWQLLVEERKQSPNEPGSAYVLHKVKICRWELFPLMTEK